MGTADYWCTWATQSATRAERRASGALAFPRDQGLPDTRDNLDENAVFGPDGWAGLFPEHRGGLLFLLDDGWDVPYGAKPAGDGIRAFGSLIPDPVRFPPRSAGASGRDQLRELARRVEDAGWKGLGVWVACQAPGERHEAPFDEAALPLLDPAKGSWTPAAEARFDAALEPGVPVGVFGRFGSLVLDDRTEGRRVAARDLLGGEPVDLTARCVREAGRIVLPGEALAAVGASRNPPGDDSEPGALVEVV